MSGIFSNTKIISEEQVSSMEEVAQNIEGFVEHHKVNKKCNYFFTYNNIQIE